MPNSKTEDFYADSLKALNRSGVQFMVGGTFAVNAYLDMDRPTKDMDIFCKAGDYPKLLETLSKAGSKIRVEDERWLAKAYEGKNYIDIIFNSMNGVVPITDQWLKDSQEGSVLGTKVRLLPPTELIWSKVFVQERQKYDGNDIAHLILTKNKNINFKRLLGYLDPYWEVLLSHVLRFRFIYPSEREIIPRWLLDELLARLNRQISLPASKVKVCRGRLFSVGDFEIDVQKWGFADLIGWQNEPQA